MRLLNLSKISVIAIFAFSFVFSASVKAADTTALSISLTNPAQAQIIISSGLAISGRAPAGVIVTVSIQDEEYQKIFQVHETNLITEGTTTSDKNGDWVFIPSKNLVPGKYSAVASFQNTTTSGSISSEKIFFTVADNNGATSWFSIPGITLVLVVIAILIAIIYVAFRIYGSRKRTILLHTTWGDIPVREIVNENNIVEIVPISEPMINLGQSPMQQIQPPVVQSFPVMQQTPVQTVQSRPVLQPVQPVQVQQVQVTQPVPQQVIQQPVQQPQPIQQVEAVQPTQIIPQRVQTPSVNPFQGRPVIKTGAQLLN